MTAPTPTPPLWQEMQKAADSVPFIYGTMAGGRLHLRRARAAEMRAVADRILKAFGSRPDADHVTVRAIALFLIAQAAQSEAD